MATIGIIAASVFGWFLAMIAFFYGTDIWTTMLIYLATSLGGSVAWIAISYLRQTESGRWR